MKSLNLQTQFSRFFSLVFAGVLTASGSLLAQAPAEPNRDSSSATVSQSEEANTEAAAATPTTVSIKLANQAPLEIALSRSLPRETLISTFLGGPALVPKELGGLSSMLSHILDEGPASLSSDEYRHQLFLLASDIGFSDSYRTAYVVVKAPETSFSNVLALARKTLREPKFTEEVFKKAKAAVLTRRLQEEDSMQSMVFYSALRDLFNYHPDTFSGMGSRKAIESVTLEKLKEFHAKIFDLKNAFYTAVGPVEPNKVRDLMNSQWLTPGAPGAYSPVRLERVSIKKLTRSTPRYTLINKPGATDNQILYLLPSSIKKDKEEFVHGSLVHEILGGGLSGRLGETLRVKRGLTYGANSFIGRNLPVWGVYTFGGIKETPGLLQGVEEVVGKFRTEALAISDLNEARMALESSFKGGQELPQDKLYEMIHYRIYDLDPRFIDKYLGLLAKTEIKHIKKFIEKNIQLKGANIYLMGDKDVVLPILEKLGTKKSQVRVLEIGDIL